MSKKNNKKILLIAYDFPPKWGGVATYAFELANGLKDEGCEVTILTGDPKAEDIKGFEIKRVKLGRTGISSIPRLTFHIAKILKRESFDAIFCCLWLPEGVSTYLAQKRTGSKIPYYIAVHAMEIMEANASLRQRFRQKLKPLKQACFSTAKAVFCVSHYSKNLLHSLIQLPEEKTIVVNNGANPNKFFPAKEKENSSGLRLLTACRLVPNKGIDQVIKVLPELVNTFPKLQYRVAGNGPDLRRLQHLTEMMQMQDHVHFLGKIDDANLLLEFQNADLFIMLSRKEKHYVEGFGLVFLEAALCGTPSLGGQSGGVSDAIEDQITGWLVDPYSETAILQKLTAILADPAQLNEVGQVALQKTLTAKTWKHRVQEILLEINSC